MLLGFLVWVSCCFTLCSVLDWCLFWEKIIMIYNKTFVLQPLVLISNRLHIVSSFPITAARKDLHKVLNKDLADRKENSCILLERKKINTNCDSRRKLSPALGYEGELFCISVEAAASLEAESSCQLREVKTSLLPWRRILVLGTLLFPIANFVTVPNLLPGWSWD